MPPKASLMAQLSTLVARHTALGYKDPQLYLGRTIGAVCNVAFLGLFFIGAMPRTQEQIFNRFMFMFTALIGLFGGSVLAVLLVNAEGTAAQPPPVPRSSARMLWTWHVIYGLDAELNWCRTVRCTRWQPSRWRSRCATPCTV
jgi:hypothetical protein